MALTNERVKTNLCKELKLALKNAALEIPLGDYISSEATLTLCNVIEAIFIHGLKDPFFIKGSRYAKYPEPNFWPFLLQNTHKAVKMHIESLNQIKTDIGRARAWIRIVLNENSMEHYLRLFARDPATFSHYYHKYAFLRDFESYNIMTGYLKGIANITIDAPVNSSFLNSWTPTPLILAGLVAGKPARLEQLSRYQRAGLASNNDVEEVGECALDLVELGAREMPPASLFYPKSFCGVDDDEVSSVYSHPSMMDGGAESSGLVFSSTPEGNGFLAEAISESPGYTTEAYQVNVKRRKHRLRCVSKSSSEEGAYSRSGSDSNLLIVNKQKIAKENSSSSKPMLKAPLSSSELLSVGSKSSPINIAGNSISDVSTKGSGTQVKDAIVSQNGPVGKSESGEVCFCEDSCDSGVAEVSLPNTESTAPLNAAVGSSGIQTDNENLCLTKDAENSMTHEKSELSLPISEGRNRDDSILSLQDELILAENGVHGNSLLGKGWAFCSPQSSQQEWEENSGQSSSLRTNSSHNFDSLIRDVVTECENDELETSAGNHVASENVSETCKSDGLNNVEISLNGAQVQKARANEESFIVLISSKSTMGINTAQNSSADDEGEINVSNGYAESQYLGLYPLLSKIPHELGLASQNFRCASCSKSIGPTFSSYRVCGFDGKYYCTNCCHKSDQSIIPSRLMHNWDIKPRSVCRTNLQFLKSIEDRPVMRLDKINPTIYEHSSVMKKIMTLRGKLALAAMYLLSCRQSVAEDLRLRLWPKEYLYNDIHLYSFSDFQNAISGQLEGHLNSIIRYAVNHIFNCKLCVQKGFFCEICSSREVIYPFQVETTIRCTVCFSVYHKRCYENNQCRKCARREHYAERASSLKDHLILD